MLREDEAFDVARDDDSGDVEGAGTSPMEGATALQKLLSVAETVSQFYSAQIDDAGSTVAATLFKGSLFAYQQKVCVTVGVPAANR
jgi:hypothetical protein